MGLCFLQKWIDLIAGAIPAQTTRYNHDTRRSLQSLALFDPEVNIVGNHEGVKSTIERLASKSKRMQQEYLGDDIMDAVVQKIRKVADPGTRFFSHKMGKEQKDRMKILEKIAKVDTTKVINKVTEEVISVGYQFHSVLLNILSTDQLEVLLEAASKKSNITFTLNNMSQYTEITDIFAQLAELLAIGSSLCSLCPGPICVIPLPEAICPIVIEISRIFTCFIDNNVTETVFEDGIKWAHCLYTCR